ncbi:MAG: dTMP kinase [bacterium]
MTSLHSPELPGTFITLEGVDGSGKSTQAGRLAGWVSVQGLEVAATREPGGPPVAERIREILLDPGSPMGWETEVLLYLASRAEHVARVIRPALEAGKVVICDRFLDSTLAYQAYGRETGRAAEEDAEAIREANQLAAGGIEPDLTLLLDIDPVRGLQRARDAGRGADRLEGEGRAFLERVRRGFLALAEASGGRIRVIDAERNPEVIEEEIRTIIRAHLGRKGLL